jgi:predicted RNA-binding protein with PUA-like domain
MKKGDKVFIYHSVIKPMAIMGIAEVVKESYPDYFSLNPESRYFDPKSTQENPRWFMVDVKAIRDINPPVTLEELKKIPELENMMLLRKGSRLSIQPVTKNEFEIILKLRNIKL